MIGQGLMIYLGLGERSRDGYGWVWVWVGAQFSNTYFSLQNLFTMFFISLRFVDVIHTIGKAQLFKDC